MIDIKKMVARVKATVKKNPILDVLNYFLLKDGVMYCTNLEHEYSFNVPYKDVTGLVPIGPFLEACSKGKFPEISFFETKVKINSGTYLISSNVEDFPVLFGENDEYTQVPIGIFHQTDIVMELSRFCSTDDLRPNLKGVYFNETEFAATDANILGWRKSSSGDKWKGIIPFNAIKLLFNGNISMLTRLNKDNIKIGGHIKIWDHDQSVVIRLVDGNFPNYKCVIPTEFNVKCEFDTKELISCLKEAIPSLNKSHYKIKLTPTADSITVYGEDFDLETEFEKTISARCSLLHPGELFSIYLNAKSLISILEVSDEPIIYLLSPRHTIKIGTNNILMPLVGHD